MMLTQTLFVVQLKHYSFWPSADVKPVSDDLLHAMLSLYVYTMIFIKPGNTKGGSITVL